MEYIYDLMFTQGINMLTVFHPERDAIRRKLENRGIATGLHYPVPIHLQPAYADLGCQAGDYPAAERAAQTCLTLPLYPELTHNQQDLVIAALHEILG